MIEGELVTAIRTLAGRGVGKKTIAREVGVAVNTVRRYLRQPIAAGQQVRPAARRLTDDRREEARALYEGPAAGNAVVVQRLLAERGCAISVRTIERAVADIRRAQRVAALATVRVETAPGDQLQIDFGQKRLQIAGARVRIFLLVAVLSYSRRLFVKAFLNERGDDWREGIAGALHAFRRRAADAARRQCAGVRARPRPRDGHGAFPSGLPGLLSRLGRAAARVRAVSRADEGQDRSRREIRQAQRARGRRPSTSFAALEPHLAAWMIDRRSARATGRRMKRRSCASSATSARRCARCRVRALPAAEQRLRRRVALDAFVDVDTVRYSVPHRLVRDHVEVVVEEQRVRIFHGTDAGRHARAIAPSPSPA